MVFSPVTFDFNSQDEFSLKALVRHPSSNDSIDPTETPGIPRNPVIVNFEIGPTNGISKL